MSYYDGDLNHRDYVDCDESNQGGPLFQRENCKVTDAEEAAERDNENRDRSDGWRSR